MREHVATDAQGGTVLWMYTDTFSEEDVVRLTIEPGARGVTAQSIGLSRAGLENLRDAIDDALEDGEGEVTSDTGSSVPKPKLEKTGPDDGAPAKCPECGYWTLLQYENQAVNRLVIGLKCEWCGYREEKDG